MRKHYIQLIWKKCCWKGRWNRVGNLGNLENINDCHPLKDENYSNEAFSGVLDHEINNNSLPWLKNGFLCVCYVHAAATLDAILPLFYLAFVVETSSRMLIVSTNQTDSLKKSQSFETITAVALIRVLRFLTSLCFWNIVWDSETRFFSVLFTSVCTSADAELRGFKCFRGTQSSSLSLCS